MDGLYLNWLNKERRTATDEEGDEKERSDEMRFRAPVGWTVATHVMSNVILKFMRDWILHFSSYLSYYTRNVGKWSARYINIPTDCRKGFEIQNLKILRCTWRIIIVTLLFPPIDLAVDKENSILSELVRLSVKLIRFEIKNLRRWYSFFFVNEYTYKIRLQAGESFSLNIANLIIIHARNQQ